MHVKEGEEEVNKMQAEQGPGWFALLKAPYLVGKQNIALLVSQGIKNVGKMWMGTY